MSLITRCPACGTMFKVVADQLRISEGWVRCGHCAEVFDAQAHLHDPSAPPPEPAGEIPAEAAVEPIAAPVTDPWVEPVHEADSSAVDPVVHEPVEPMVDDFRSEDEATILVEPPADSASAAAFRSVFEEPERDTPEESAEAAAPAGDAASGYEIDAAPPEADADDPWPSEAAEEASPAATPSFVRQANRKAFWRKPAVRVTLWLLCLLLLGALAVQTAVQERDRIAAQWPQTRPLLQQLCGFFQCEIGALRKIESVVVEGTSFTRLRTDAYRLDITLKNNAGVDVAMPSIELTLTDTQDRPIVRRVLSPADMSAASTLAAAAEWSGSVPIAVTAAASGGRVAGYRVLAFYP